MHQPEHGTHIPSFIRYTFPYMTRVDIVLSLSPFAPAADNDDVKKEEKEEKEEEEYPTTDRSRVEERSSSSTLLPFYPSYS